MATSTLAINRLGFHGPVTATLDWCEANYQFSYYIAEMANCFSNLFSISLALLGARNVFREGLPGRYSLGFLGFLFVGIGSLAFHATLLYHWQLADELPMIYVASTSFWLLSDLEPGFDMTSRATLLPLFATGAFDGLFTLSYVFYRNPVYHQCVFAGIILATAGRLTYLMQYSPIRTKISEEKRALCTRSFWTGGFWFIFAFFIWNMDNIFCDPLTNLKTHIGWPSAFLLEGHSWWHVFTGIGAYYMAVGVQCTSLCLKGDHRQFGFRYLHGLPFVAYTKGKKE
ncbi:alkaline phytoceramidase [Cylindrobasidium torrendii FP15055 ss-10]|uniref:Alkaline phytoceramidase n=1 Tax=Cylindrobasidium torrendii FP15055 ss-10 TaxID=1314674 RepID=A0A0D7BTI1_9AGAR|nr:alkaline phytoceramidase [Cylindrobasidium torrendii FP15055 ss-10]